MHYISRSDIESVIEMRDAVEAVKQAFSMYEKGQINTPLRTVIRTREGSMLFMPAYSQEMGIAVMKNVNLFPGNKLRGESATQAVILLIDARTGHHIAMLDGTCVTQLRTGAASGAAFDILARKRCRKGALIGTGGMAEAQLEAMLAVRNLSEVSIFSPNAERCEDFTTRMRERFGTGGVSISRAASAEECVTDADLIITVTTSCKPVFDGRLVKPGATVSCVGTYEQEKHEIDPALIVRADKIYCDSREAVLSESGDVLIPIREGLIPESAVLGGLGEVINGTLPGRESEDEIIVFETVGIGAQDLTTAGMICSRIAAAQRN